MPSLDQSVTGQFGKVFASSDWPLFKEMAEIYFSEAAFLKKSAFKAPDKKKLLVRNCRKRLLIGIGSELLIKAVFLKAGYCINKPENENAVLKLPFTPAQATGIGLNPARTYTFDNLIGQLNRVIILTHPQSTLEGLRIAKVFRNKEGHVVTGRHKFDPLSYRAIENALVALYADSFQERLKVHFSFAPNERGVWQRQ